MEGVTWSQDVRSLLIAQTYLTEVFVHLFFVQETRRDEMTFKDVNNELAEWRTATTLQSAKRCNSCEMQ